MINEKIKIIFIGTSDFGLPSLKKIHSDPNFDLIAIITQPDKKAGRKQVLRPSPIKSFAKENDLPLFQPEKIVDVFPDLKILSPDIIVVVAYAQIIPQEILDLPRYGCLNIHGSLLPKYRGASCVQWPIINGDKKTGITIIKMDSKLDTGPIVAQKEIKIDKNDTAKSLHDKLSELSAKIIVSTLKDFIKGKIKPVPQDNSKSSYVKTLKKSDGKIDWNQTAEEIERFIRAMQPWPGAFFNYQLKIKNYELDSKHIIIKILKPGDILNPLESHKPGTLFIHNQKLFVQCTDLALEIQELQPEGKKPMPSKQFINGYSKYLSINY